jgi:glycosyltransferase involved in cell wall biosynthesis
LILVFEMTWTGTTHAPGNSATVQVIARGFPGQDIRIFADPTHVRELRRDAALTAHANVSFREIAVSPHHRGKTHIVSWPRFRQELATLRAAVAEVPRGEKCLIMLISATPTAIAAASLVARLSRGRVGVQVGLHGNLNEISGWRSRNPVVRAFDLPAMMVARHPPMLRFLVLEQAVKDELARIAPAAAQRTDVVPLPVNLTEMPARSDLTLAEPVRIGFVGQATLAKGIDVFLDVAREFKQRYGDRIAFTLVGRAMPGTDLAPFDILAEPVGTEHLSRVEFGERLGCVHYVFLPFREGGYYNLSPSGALIDAITWLKPVIATRIPLVERFFERFGDIGFMCDDAEGMRRALEEVMTGMDAARYVRQVDAMGQVRDSRMPDAIGGEYRRVMAEKYPGLLPG